RNHSFGWEAEAAVDAARAEVARLIGARDPKEVVFTSGGTESINLALKGAAEMYREKGNHLVTTVIEQRAGLDVAKRLERQGFEVTYVPVQSDGLVDVDAIRAAITPTTVLISVMYANHEIGTIQDAAGSAGGRVRPGGGDLPRGHVRRERASRDSSRPASRRGPVQGGRSVPQRPSGTAPAPQPEHLLLVRGRGIRVDGPQQGSG